ncbi:hypothetical protein EVAR_30817_1 [Eumeta japonica]|uniref:Uncharacterized protein n=1 Tax=Eumeta variegata TaxID=151549 RepID=A0A4C2A763_EUMVA|nr:hypothetical protein EVAR_30817_1 [Eumeta japonica]
MTSRSKEKVAAAFRKLFRSPEKLNRDGAGAGGSPARRGLLRRHSDRLQRPIAACITPDRRRSRRNNGGPLKSNDRGRGARKSG